mmetsp:Transcript_990/g.2722  ORF Transcript_990/g.2722 Transcript_990/m.2722 type:complete len:324 (-) Transcript_990:223-1194(-)
MASTLGFDVAGVGEEKVVCVCDSKSAVGEGPVWDPAEQMLRWVDIEGRMFYQWRWGDASCEATPTTQRVGSFGLLGGGKVLAALETGFAVFQPSTGVTTPVPSGFAQDEAKLLRLNDGKTDREGRFVAGGFNAEDCDTESWKPAIGVYRVGPKAEGERLLDEDFRCANAICFSPDGATMYFTDSPSRKLLAFNYSDTSALPLRVAEARVIADLDEILGEGSDGVFDGACVDAAGNIWVAICFGGVVLHLSPANGVLRIIEMPVKRPTCPVLAGPDLDTLFITSIGPRICPPEELTEYPLSGGLFAIKVSAPGLPEPMVVLEDA